MPEQPDATENADSTREGEPSTRELRLSRSFQFGRALPHDILPPETIARLRAGGQLTPAELAKVRAAALARSGLLGRFVAALTSHADAPLTANTSPDARTAGTSASPDSVVVPGSVRSFEWSWSNERGSRTADTQPATYFEALTGGRDPARSFLVTARRIINGLVWVIALGLPLVLVVVALATGQSAQTVVVVGIAAFAIGMMFRHSFPRTPFG